jgi:hypothetical protein
VAEKHMNDLIVLIGLVGFFALTAALARLLERV